MAISATKLASGISTAATTTCSFSAQAAGTWLILHVSCDDYRTTSGSNRPESTGWSLGASGQDEIGFYVWHLVAAGGETSVSYTIGSATNSSWEVIAVTGAAGTLYNTPAATHTHGGSTTTSGSVTPPAAPAYVLGLLSAYHSSTAITGATHSNSYTQVGFQGGHTSGNRETVASAGLATTTATATSTAATWTGTNQLCSYGAAYVFTEASGGGNSGTLSAPVPRATASIAGVSVNLTELAGGLLRLTGSITQSALTGSLSAGLPSVMSGQIVELRRNYAPIPAPVDDTGWNSNNAAVYPKTYDPTGGRRAGTGATKSTRTTNTLNSVLSSQNSIGLRPWSVANRVPVAPGEVWTLSAYVKSSVAFSASVGVAFYDAAGTQVGSLVYGASAMGGAYEWVRPYATVTVPAGATNMGIYNLGVYKSAGSAVGGEETWTTDALYEKSATLGDYFDGSYSPDPEATPGWTGTPNASVSTLQAAVRTSGQQINPGDLTDTLPKAAGAIAGQQRNIGVLAADLPDLTDMLTGQAVNAGDLTRPLPKVTGTLTGIATNPGGLDASLPQIVGGLADQPVNLGSLAGSLPAPTGAVTGAAVIPATLAGTVQRAASSITAQHVNRGMLAATPAKPTGTLVGASTNPVTLASVMPAAVAAINATTINAAMLTAVLAVVRSASFVVGVVGKPVHSPRMTLTVTASTMTLTAPLAGMTLTTTPGEMEIA